MNTEIPINSTAKSAALQSPAVDKKADSTGGVVQGTMTTVFDMNPNEVAM